VRTLVGLVFAVACSSGSKSEPPAADPPSSITKAAPPADAAATKTELDGIPVAVALPDGNVYGVAVDAERVFVIGTSIHVAPRAGGPLKTLVEVGIDEATEKPVVTDERELARQTAGQPEVAAAVRSARWREYAKNYRNPVVHGGYLYVQNLGTEARTSADATIERVAVAGGAPEVIIKNVEGGISTMAVDATGITIVTHTNAVLRYPAAGGPPSTLFPASPTTEQLKYELADGGTSVFVAKETYDKDYKLQDATIARISKTGGKPVTIAKKLSARARDLAADATHLYWCDGDHAGIWRIDHQGRGKVLVAKGYADALRVTETHLVWRAKNDTLAWMRKSGGTVETRQLPGHATIEAVDRDTIWLASERYVLRVAVK